MVIKSNNFEISNVDFTHSMYYFDELVAIIQFIEKNNDKELSAIDFILNIPLVRKWKELAMEQNLYFLKNINVLEIERTVDSPVRKYRFKVNTPNFSDFKKMTENKFELRCDFSIDEYLIFFNNIYLDVKSSWWEKLIKHWRETILSGYNQFENKSALIKERDFQIEKYNSDRNLLKFYDISDFRKLAEKLKDAVDYREKIPLNPDNFISSLLTPMDNLKNALEIRFKQKLQIDTLKYLIKSQENVIDFIQTCNLKQKDLLEKLFDKITITERLNYWVEIEPDFEKSYPLRYIGTLKVPEVIYKEFFEPFINLPEYFKWLDNYEIQLYFQNSELFKTLQTKFNGKFKKEFIESELEKINNFEKETSILKKEDLEKEVETLKRNLTIDNNSEYSLYLAIDNKRAKKAKDEIQFKEQQIEFLKITEETAAGKYYDKNTIAENWHDTSSLQNNITVQTYIKHILYKPYLENKLQEVEQPSKPLLENSISVPKNEDKSLLEIINEIPDRAKKAFEIYQIEFKRLNNSRQAKTNMIRQIFDAKEIYVCKNYENTRTQIVRDFKKYNLISQKTTTRK